MHRFAPLLLTISVGCTRSVAVEDIQVSDMVAPSTTAYEPGLDDWPGWRGPLRNGLTTSSPPPLNWSPTENVVWKASVPGRGHASPVVVKDRVLLSSAEESEERQLLVAFDRETGAEAWRVTLHEGGFPSAGEVHQKGTDANGTVASDGERIYVAHLNSDSIVASAVDWDGKIIWQTTLGPFRSKFGYAPSPTLYGSYVIFAADNWGGGYLAAVNRETGEIAWRKQRSSTSTYSSPTVARVAGRDQLLISGDNQVASYDPATGESLWSCRGASEATCGTLVWDEDLVFASGGFPGQQTLAVRADGTSEILWSNQVKIYEPSLLVVGQELYGTSDQGIVYCWDSRTGEERWRKRVGGSFSASPIVCEGLIYAQKASGELIVFRASPEGYEEVASNRLGDETLASPALCGGRLYLRVVSWDGDDRHEHLYCIADTEGGAIPR
ncbi:outer membrane biogenesis protein BamB [Botrimarina colliarenosi]|uniref:Outer membrane biogenesis protein BamB n=1 Tax=Botrimarina colliarenosi TaxID=2528001 RepID=A0A5C6A5J0_9BACT|nr:PQQ-like beta-propeller repeat protein [Botrimarina colliarenosi]TWT95214.1 outer membrane biogenesis protein BamB [Botrimarina colliarenosi]